MLKVLILILSLGVLAFIGSSIVINTTKIIDVSQPGDQIAELTTDPLFGWKFPITTFPITGPDGRQIAYSTLRNNVGSKLGLPVRLQIPVIKVDAAIEDALITPDGRMDVPAGSKNVAWFAPGPHPGDVGSAVIGGHYGIQGGVPFVFYRLNQVKVGSVIKIINDKHETKSFVVTRTQSFGRDDDATTVFTSGDSKAHLNLITCEGIWNKTNGSYPRRLVLFTDATN